MVTVEIDPQLSVVIEPGDESAYLIEIVYDGDTMTSYSSNADPWSESGRMMLGNVIARWLDGYERDGARQLLARAFSEHEPTLEAAFE